MKHDEKERKQQWKMMNKREKTMKTDYIKIWKKTMKNDETEKKNNEKMKKKRKTTMKNDEK